MPVLMYGSGTMICRQKERFRIRAVQIDNLSGWLRIRRMNKVSNRQIKGDMWSDERGRRKD